MTLNIDVQGFSTGMLSYETHTFSLSVNLIQHHIEVVVDQNVHDITLKMEELYNIIIAKLKNC